MGDTKIVYDEEFGFGTFKREICAKLGNKFWDELVKDIPLPDMAAECECKCHNMYVFMERFNEAADAETVKNILYNVRHGLHPSQSAWAREEFLKTGDLDEFLRKHHEKELEYFVDLNRDGKDFYGQEITDEVLEFIKCHRAMLAPVRRGNKLYCMAFPCNMNEYLRVTDDKVKRYHACHCQFAKESILSDHVVSAALCSCSLGHVMNFTEAFLGRALDGKVVRSALNGDLTCEYEIDIPNDIMEDVKSRESSIIISNYYSYYKSFALSNVVELHEGNVDWIAPKAGCTGPDLAFNIKLNEHTAQQEIQELVAGIKEQIVPRQWIVTSDAEPKNIIALLEENGFVNLSSGADPEPAMLMHKYDFQPCHPQDRGVVCRRVQSKKDFRIWIDIVNTALHGWDMIDADNYYTWVESGALSIYLGEIDGVPVSTAATIQNGSNASLEFVSTLKQYRRRQVASAVCSKAIEDLLDNGVNAVTLAACGDSDSLYAKLGFHRVFDNIIMRYEDSK